MAMAGQTLSVHVRHGRLVDVGVGTPWSVVLACKFKAGLLTKCPLVPESAKSSFMSEATVSVCFLLRAPFWEAVLLGQTTFLLCFAGVPRLPKRLRHVPFGLHVYGAAALEQTRRSVSSRWVWALGGSLWSTYKDLVRSMLWEGAFCRFSCFVALSFARCLLSLPVSECAMGIS